LSLQPFPQGAFLQVLFLRFHLQQFVFLHCLESVSKSHELGSDVGLGLGLVGGFVVVGFVIVGEFVIVGVIVGVVVGFAIQTLSGMPLHIQS